jgi:hypothetical protein
MKPVYLVKTPFVLFAVWIILKFEPDGSLLGLSLYGVPYGAMIVAIALLVDTKDIAKYLKSR